VADRTIVGMMPGDDTPRDSVRFGVGAVAFSGEMVRNMAVCAVVAELVFGELCHGLTCADCACKLSLGLHLFLSYLTPLTAHDIYVR
jgi:hypothetical protein